jgi:hypothetical protein
MIKKIEKIMPCGYLLIITRYVDIGTTLVEIENPLGFVAHITKTAHGEKLLFAVNNESLPIIQGILDGMLPKPKLTFWERFFGNHE